MSVNPEKIATNADSIKAEYNIDTCGTRCPLPLLRAKQALKEMAPGEMLRILATDPAAKSDFDAMLKHLPHSLVAYRRSENLSGKYPRIDTFVIRKGNV